jgi:NADH-quinone oxidoreductase subunit L
MSNIELLLVTGVLIPLGSFVLLALFGSRLGKPLAGWVAVAAIAASCALGTAALVQWQGMTPAARAAAHTGPYSWAQLGSVPLTFGVNLDSLTLIMFFMVSFVSTCIFVFSVGYMAGHSDEIDGVSKFHRFFTYLCLFCFSMLLLVIADSLLLLFIAWELVGLCSYLLIGFYFHKKSASNAAIKAFVTNRVGDFGFIIGISLVYLFLGDLSLKGAAETFRHQWEAGGPLFAKTFLGLSLATWMGMLLFCGAIGKSAQFPLHVWLPDAMEGPTPVSALIHAATMVAAGVYLTARIFVLLTPEAQLFVAIIGCITLTLAALVAVVQTDIKKVLAYSTISQLGYMMLGMGVGAWIAALFHLLTHAYFKALMFLGSGQVIEGTHHEQDIRKMGGLWRKMPVTAVTFLVGVLAIAGFGIPTTHFGLGGFFSKDEILAVAWHRAFGREHAPYEEHAQAAPGQSEPEAQARAKEAWEPGKVGTWEGEGAGVERAAYAEPASATHEPGGISPGAAPVHVRAATHAEKPGPGWLWALLFVVPVGIAYVTPFYMMRAWWLTFMGKPRDEHVHEHAHESPLMYLPLVVLAIGTFVSSYFLFRPMVAEALPHPFLTAAFDGEAASAAHAHGAMIDHGAHAALAKIVGFAFVIGFLAAWLIYHKGLGLAESLAKALRPLHTLLIKKFYFDEAYGLVLIGGTMALKGLSYAFDKYVVDGLVNLSAWVTERVSRFSGVVLDAGLVDGLVNLVGRGTYGVGGVVRAPQDGRIRNYVLFAAGSVALVAMWMAFG